MSFPEILCKNPSKIGQCLQKLRISRVVGIKVSVFPGRFYAKPLKNCQEYVSGNHFHKQIWSQRVTISESVAVELVVPAVLTDMSMARCNGGQHPFLRARWRQCSQCFRRCLLQKKRRRQKGVFRSASMGEHDTFFQSTESGQKKQPKDKVLGLDIPPTSGTHTLCKAPFSVVLGTEWPGCPSIWVGTCRNQKDFRKETLAYFQKNPRAHKNKIGTPPPPPPKIQNTPPP